MLIIRPEQIRVFENHARSSFVLEMCAHLRLHFASGFQGMDEQELIDFVDSVLKGAGEFGLTSRRDCARFLNLAAVFGQAFPRLPEFQWARRILIDAGVSEPSARLHLLVDECLRRRALQEAEREWETGVR